MAKPVIPWEIMERDDFEALVKSRKERKRLDYKGEFEINSTQHRCEVVKGIAPFDY